jgi:hypothetical protein
MPEPNGLSRYTHMILPGILTMLVVGTFNFWLSTRDQLITQKTKIETMEKQLDKLETGMDILAKDVYGM